MNLIILTLLNLLGFETTNPKTLYPRKNIQINPQTLLIVGVIVALIVFVILTFTFVPVTETGVMRNTLNNI